MFTTVTLELNILKKTEFMGSVEKLADILMTRGEVFQTIGSFDL